MGYESRLYVTHPYDKSLFSPGEKRHAEILCVMNLCKMPECFFSLKKTPIDYELFIDNEYTSTDRYGKEMYKLDIDELISLLEEYLKTDFYRRIPPLLQMLKGYKEVEKYFKELDIVHYGY